MSTPEARLPSGLVVPQSVANERLGLPELEPFYDLPGGGRLILRDTTTVPDGSGRMVRAVVYGTKRGIAALVSNEETRRWGVLRRVSVTFKFRYPSWEEMKMLKTIFYGDQADAMLVMPKQEDPGNRTLHLWQCPQEWTVA